MGKIRNLAAAALAFILVSTLIAGCGGKMSLQESQTQIPVSQNKNTAGENDTYGFTHNGSETAGHDGESFDGSVNTTENTDPAGDRTTADDVSPPQSTTEPQNTDGPKPTQSATKAPATEAEAKPAQTPEPEPEQKPTNETTPLPAPTQKPTESPSTAPAVPVQPPSSVTLPIAVSDAAAAAADTVITAITNVGMSEFDKVKAIHDYIVVNVDYPAHIEI